MGEPSSSEWETKASPLVDPSWIVLVSRDYDREAQLAAYLQSSGYRIQLLASLADLPAALGPADAQPTALKLPLAVIVELERPDGSLITTIDREDPTLTKLSLPPIIFTSARSDLQARLHAVRAGGYSYFTQPLDLIRLVDTLDDLTARLVDEPYRVLIVEDSPLLAEYLSATLTRAGMSTRMTTDPFEVLPLIAEFQPELLLVDLYMPKVSGSELAAVIRQQPAHIGMSIVFLSGETDRTTQLVALKGGGDDFLTKPIAADDLVATLSVRLRRARQLRHQITHDGLTGLLNHMAMIEQLKIELGRGLRCETPVSIAMIDLDRFKLVNDTYGHLAGDRVLKNTARLLLQRLRRSDHSARYGGEEFMLVLVGTDGPAAVQVLNELRERFAQFTHQHDESSWTATFSAGVAAFPDYSDSTTLIKAADSALYTAKQQGGNCVVLR